MFLPPLTRLLLPAALGVSLLLPGAVGPDTVRAQTYGSGANVWISHYMFQPSVIRIVVGTTVTWTNYDGVQHTTTSDTGAWNSGPINPGMSFQHTFTAPGTYWYHCMIHPFMRGEIIVVAASQGRLAATVNPVRNGGTTVVVGQGFTPNSPAFLQWRRPNGTMTGVWTFTRPDGSFAVGIFANPRNGCGPRIFMAFDSRTGQWSPQFVLNEIC